MLSPGVGTLTLTAPPRPILVRLGLPFPSPVREALSCRLTATGSRLPPITRNAAWPPNDVKSSGAPSGFQNESPPVSDRLASPTVARAPNAVPLPMSSLGMPRSPLITTPVPPFGLLQFGIPRSWAAAGVATQAASASTVRVRFIRILQHTRPSAAPRYFRGRLARALR